MRIETDEISLCSRKMITWKGDLVMSLLMNGSYGQRSSIWVKVMVGNVVCQQEGIFQISHSSSLQPLGQNSEVIAGLFQGVYGSTQNPAYGMKECSTHNFEILYCCCN